MRERPILFSAPMIRAILAGEKTQTRRVMKPQPAEESSIVVERYHPEKVNKRTGELYPGDEVFGAYNDVQGWVCPYGQPGDRLWVRETFAVSIHDPDCAFTPSLADRDAWDDLVVYRADNESGGEWTHEDGNGARVPIPTPWRPSIHMPRWASRLTLEVTGVRVERLHEISEEDAIAEGVQPCGGFMATSGCWANYGENGPSLTTARESFASLWRSINGAESWDANPYVWCVSFKRVDSLEGSKG